MIGCAIFLLNVAACLSSKAPLNIIPLDVMMPGMSEFEVRVHASARV
jgi:CheY-like chemotaxis protein